MIFFWTIRKTIFFFVFSPDIPDRNILWRLSFSKAEKKLLTYANSKDPSAFKKNAFRFTKKCIQDLRESNPGKIEKFCSYHLKQFMFSQYDTWPKQIYSETCIQKFILENLIHALSRSNPRIYSYFIPNDNVLKYIPQEEIDLISKGLQEKVRTFFWATANHWKINVNFCSWWSRFRESTTDLRRF
jgi:hypothetical protein